MKGTERKAIRLLLGFSDMKDLVLRPQAEWALTFFCSKKSKKKMPQLMK